ncbi:PREDICTED: putative disease resistance protein RGA3 [Nelumbo nucifera]|uniref:Disease resistance protein RGA3 n=2 Tax=Nelumbo nucifera TaxID=4432 RepID=A0A1U7ZQD0_NELNU|nr:PREDICTED: putative disease resistance protein RGA3 [Nelumbo nucifera]DAD39205.1 TPA_asm: hypothetical protein HUJ06_013528 [Nelumbo nucifera]
MAVVILTAVASASLKPVFEKLGSFVSNQIKLIWGADDVLKKLERTLLRIQAVIDDVEDKQIDDKAWKVWLRDLKDAAYDADDILDKIGILISEKKLDQNTPRDKHEVRNLVLRSLKHSLPRKMNNLQRKLDTIAKEMEDLHLKRSLKRIQPDKKERPQTSSLITEPSVLGRKKDKNNLIQMLMSTETCSENVSVISVVGMGGIGKTTLAQIVYNDETVQRHFPLRMWVCVTKDFSVRRITKSIVESITVNHPLNEISSARSSFVNVADLDPLQITLEGLVRQQRFLLVLDDMWNESYSDWNLLRAPLRVGANGSKILVTTRSRIVSLATGCSHTITLQGLSDTDCELLLERKAFASGTSNAHPQLISTGKKIAQKCKGLPLAVTTLGSLLSSVTNEGEWDAILISEIWNLERNNDILPALWLSYLYLPAHLKRCFAYCSIFPKGHKFRKEKLVQLWVAEGFVHQDGKRRLEVIGGNYFDTLLWRSFFQITESNGSSSVCYHMHDFIHDLAKSVSRDECLRIEDGDISYKPYIITTVRHSSWLCKSSSGAAFKDVPKMERLRTILLQCDHKEHIHPLPNLLGTKFKRLRVLDLSGAQIEDLPSSIGSLKYLRYLDLSSTLIERLPKLVCGLLNIETLKLADCKRLAVLPSMNKMRSLRHLYLDDNPQLNSMPPMIGELTGLETISPFIVSTEDGRKIGEMNKMASLRGSFCISRLENVGDVKEAMMAALKDKPHIHQLMLDWSKVRECDQKVDEETIQGLEAHKNLKELHISNYCGEIFPIWITDPSYSNLMTVSLSNCQICSELPPFGQLPYLKSLRITKMDSVDCISNSFYGKGEVRGFPSLETLEFSDMGRLSIWYGVNEGDFRRLQRLTVDRCPRLTALPVVEWINSLPYFQIRKSGRLEEWKEEQLRQHSNLLVESGPEHSDSEVTNHRTQYSDFEVRDQNILPITVTVRKKIFGILLALTFGMVVAVHLWVSQLQK